MDERTPLYVCYILALLVSIHFVVEAPGGNANLPVTTQSTSPSVEEKAFIVVCLNMGDPTPPVVSVGVSGAMGESIHFLGVAMNQQPSMSIQHQFYRYQETWHNSTLCASATGRANIGVHFVMSDIPVGDNSLLATWVTYQAGAMVGGYSAIPIKHLGSQYRAVTYCEIFGHCQIMIAIVDAVSTTEIVISLPTNPSVRNVKFGTNVYQTGEQFTVNGPFVEGESMLIECDCDLTQTKIISDSDVAVFSGSRNAVVGVTGTGNFLIQQLPPVRKWSKKYACSCHPYCGKEGAFIRVLARHGGTTIRMTGYRKVKTTNNMLWIQKRIEKDDVMYITADKDIMVAMFLLNDGAQPASMFLIPPVIDYTNKVAFQLPIVSSVSRMLLTVTTNDQDNLYYLNHVAQPVQQEYNFQDAHLFSHLFEIPFVADSTFYLSHSKPSLMFGVYGVAYGSNGFRLGFSLGSYYQANSVPPAPIYPGDGIDNDNSDSVDDVQCEYFTEERTNDCSVEHGENKDEQGYMFFVVFPYFESQTYFSIDMLSMSSDGITSPGIYPQKPDCVLGQCTIVSNLDTYTYSQKYQSGCVCMAMNSTGVHKSGTAIRGMRSQPEFTVTVSVFGVDTVATYLALPVDVLGLEYYTMTYCRDGGNCACTVSTIFDGTEVSIKLPSITGVTVNVEFNNFVYREGSVITTILQKFETFMFVSQNDLTGTYVTANTPVAVICGGSTGTGSFLEQMPPIFALSSSYSVIVKSDVLTRVVATEGNTIVTAHGAVKEEVLLQTAGSFRDFNSYLSLSSIVATKPVLAVSYTDTQGKGGCMFVLFPNSISSQRHYGKYPEGIASSTKYLYTYTSSSINNVTQLQEGVWSPIQEHIGIHTVYNDTADVEAISMQTTNYAMMSGRSTDSSPDLFCHTIGVKFTYTEQVCSLEPMTVGDQKDNDCDGLVDEDICARDFYKDDTSKVSAAGKYIPDFDIDGMMDEDCFTEIPVPSSSSSSLVTTLAPTPTPTLSIISTEMSAMQTSSTPTIEYTTPFISPSDTPSSSLSPSESPSPSVSPSHTASPSLSPSASPSPNLSPTETASPTMSPTDASTPVMSTPMSHVTLMPTPSSNIIVASSTILPHVCYCPCTRFKPPNPAMVNITIEKLAAIVEETKKELAVNKTSLSSFVRKKTSAKDDRPSAAGIGSVGIVMLVFVSVLIIGSDLAFLQQYIRSAKSCA